ncbi:MAG TPA: hypothetical protein VLB80_04725 [Candidatus Babeliales bacterium]|nr:hypothetical protein [Candidatus Babeliales bacterium]
MKQVQLDKQTIAWFKIAECVSRGEKERALGVYRLLSHSFNDNAIARQLEADIYLSFQEKEQAVSLYQQAMESYHKSNRFLEAAAVGEHLIIMCPINDTLRRELVRLYILLGMIPNARMHISASIDSLAHKQQWYEIKHMIGESAHFSDLNGRTALYSDILIIAYKRGCSEDILLQSIHQAIDDLIFANDEQYIQRLLLSLQTHSDELYEHALSYVMK